MDPQGGSTQAILDTTIELRRTQRILRSTLETRDERIHVDASRPAAAKTALELLPDQSPEGKQVGKQVDAASSQPADPLIAYGWQRLLNVICAIFARDWEESNELSMSQGVKCDFSNLKLLGTGTNFIVRKLPDLPAHFIPFGYPFSSRWTQRTWDVVQGVSKPRSKVCKQLRATRWAGQGQRSAASLEDVITELQILNHHPIMRHDNVIDFSGTMWEYDMDLQVWPVLCLECADHGTLDAFLDQPFILTFVQKMQLCLDVGNGLRALHGCGVIHGDIKAENVFIFSHHELGFTAKLGDFSSSAANFAGLDPSSAKLSLGGYTPLWVAPGYAGPATFEALRAMDVFSFGMLNWTVVQNGKSVLAALASTFPPSDVYTGLKECKESPGFMDLVKRAVQLPGYCEDIMLDDFAAVLESTLGAPRSRDLECALGCIRKICRSERTGERSPLRLIEDLDSGLDGNQRYFFDFKVVKHFPRPLQRQILAAKMQRLSSTTPRSSSIGFSGRGPMEEAIEIFRMIHESMGASTLGEQLMRDGLTENDIQMAIEREFDSAAADATLATREGSGLERNLPRGMTKILERLILGSICAGPYCFGPAKYRGSRNQKHATCVEVLEMGVEKSAQDILPDSMAIACLLTLGRPQGIDNDKFFEWAKHAQYGGFLSLLDFLDPTEQYKAKLEVLQLAANVKDVVPIVEVNEALARIKHGTSRAVESQLLVQRLQDWQVRVGKGETQAEVAEQRRLFDLAPFVDKLPEFRDQLAHATAETVNYQDADGRTPLLLACLYGNLEAARLLLSQGANAALASRTGQNTFHCLAYIDPSEQAGLAKELLAAGADPNSLVWLGNSIDGASTATFQHVSMMYGAPLHHAIVNKSVVAVEALLSCGADILLENVDYLTPLALAACAHCPEILDLLIQKSNVDVGSWVDHYGNSLAFAALNGEWNLLRMHLHLTNYYTCAEKTLKVLQSRGVNWDLVSVRFSVPALRFASLYSSSFVVSQLLQMGLHGGINQDYPATIRWPLHQAILRGDEHVFMLLLDNGADIHVRDKPTGDTCLHACVRAHFVDHFFIDVLLERGADIDAVDDDGRTAFYQAVIRKQFRTATYLLSRGADPEHKDVRGLTVLGSVLKDGDNILPCVRYLLQLPHPFSPSSFVVGRNNSTVLHAAAGAYKTSRTPSESKELFEYLLKKFPYREHLESQESTSGFTPLMIAVLENNIEAAKALLDAGASLDTKCLGGSCLRGARLLADLIVLSADGLIQGLDFDDAHGGRAWKDMMKLLLEASIRPDVEPKTKPAVSAQEGRRRRVDRFVELVRGCNLQYLGGQLELDDGEEERAQLPGPDDRDQSLLNEIEVPDIVLNEMELHLNATVLESVLIAQPAGYVMSREDDTYYFVPHLCWITETPTLGTKGSMGAFLKEFPPFPSIGLTFCKHIVEALGVVHGAGFTHGALNMSAVIIRTLTSGPSAIPKVIPQLYNFKWSVSARSQEAVYRKQGNEFDAPEVAAAAGPLKRPFEELVKCDVYSLGMVVVHAVARDEIEGLGSFASNPTYVSSAIAAAASNMAKGNIGSAARNKMVKALEDMLESDPAKRTSSLEPIAAAIQAALHENGRGQDEDPPKPKDKGFFRSLGDRMKRLGI